MLVWQVFLWLQFIDCPLGVVVMAITTATSVLLFYTGWEKACGCKVFRKEATVFSTSLMVNYITYMAWTAMAGMQDECNPGYLSVGNTVAQVFVGLIPTTACIFSIAIAHESHNTKPEEKKVALESVVAEKVDEEAKPKD